MDTVSLIYLVCLGAGLVFTLVSAFCGHFMGGHDAGTGHVEGSGGHAEAGADMSDMPGISAWSPTIMASFVTAFGGLGILLSQVKSLQAPYISAPLALLGAAAIAGVLLWVLRQLFAHTQGSSEGKVGTLVGTEATVLTPFPPDGVGEIAYVQGGSRYTAPAREDNGRAIAAGKTVRITRVVGTQFYVKAGA
jgi:membrane protein implicated in regulation of membrane protease activity